MKLATYFRPEMVADSECYSPSAAKPAQVVATWLEAGLPLDLRSPAPATPEELSLAHEPGFVRALLAGEIPNGFGNRSLAVARSLPYTTGAMLAAGRAAVIERTAVAAPCSGFHHAGWARAADYCSFNGLMVTAAVLQAEGLVTRVGILDCDQHFGDGTAEIIERLQAASWIQHFTAGARFSSRAQATPFLRALPALVRSFEDCDLLLYQAGADPHLRDPLGGWLETEELAERDAIVFRVAKELSLPVAWNLAGGYQRDDHGTIQPVLELHLNTALAWARTHLPRQRVDA